MAIQAVSVPTEPAADEAPRRGRGRPRMPGSDTAPRTRQPRQPAITEDAIGGLLFMVNLPLAMIPQTRDDALDPDEMTALSRGIVEQCKQSPAFRRYVQYALKASGATGLLTPLAFIGARRLARHGWLPGGAETDAQLGKMIGVLNGTVNIGEVMPRPDEPTADELREEMTQRSAPTPPVGSPVPPQQVPQPIRPVIEVVD